MGLPVTVASLYKVASCLINSIWNTTILNTEYKIFENTYSENYLKNNIYTAEDVRWVCKCNNFVAKSIWAPWERFQIKVIDNILGQNKIL